MAFRRFLRGQVPWETLEAVADEVADRFDADAESVELLEADNWLSSPLVVNERWFVKVITSQHTLLQGLLTTGRNLGALSSGTEGFFERLGDPLTMAEHEFDATVRMRELGVNAPEPLDAFEHDELGVLVLEYLSDFATLDELDERIVDAHAAELFESLAVMHDHGLVHGDLRQENVLVAGDDLYFIDATRVREAAIEDARAYDLACALAVLAPILGARRTVEAALGAYTTEKLLAAQEFLDFVNLRPDHTFDAAQLKGEIEKAAT